MAAILGHSIIERPPPDYLVASDSLSPDVPEDLSGRLAHIARDKGARQVSDSSSTPLRRGAEAGAYLLEPQVREFQELTGEEIRDERPIVNAGDRLLESSPRKATWFRSAAQGPT